MSVVWFRLAVAVSVLVPSLAASQAKRRPVAPQSSRAVGVRIDSTYDAFTDRTTLRVLNTPILALNSGTIMSPDWSCLPNAPCTLDGIKVISWVKADRWSVRDADAAEEFWNGFVEATMLDWDFVMVTPTDTVRFTWAIDSLAFSFHKTETREIFGAGTISAPTILDALLSGTSLRARQRAQFVGASKRLDFEITRGTTAWLRAVQAGHRRVVDARAAAQPSVAVVVADDPDRPVTAIGCGTRPPARDQPYFDFQVEKAAAAIPGSGNPAYPDALKSAGVEGEAIVQYIVDTTGRAEPASFKVLRASHDAFGQAVRSALPQMRFLPAEIGGCKVRMLVQQPFTFAPNR